MKPQVTVELQPSVAQNGQAQNRWFPAIVDSEYVKRRVTTCASVAPQQHDKIQSPQLNTARHTSFSVLLWNQAAVVLDAEWHVVLGHLERKPVAFCLGVNTGRCWSG